MSRFLIFFSYDGSAYHGWQAQPNGVSVQAELRKALGTLLCRKLDVVGAGRTDAGVHARRMAAHFDFEGPVDTAQLAYRLNKLLPQDIAVQGIEPVGDNFHARFSATRRTYNYYIHTRKEPFLRRYSCELHYPLDFRKMNEAAALLLRVSDFAAFCKSHTDVKTTRCNVTEARWTQNSAHCWQFTITANRFLRNMVRAIVGTLIEVGRGRMTPEGFADVVAGKDRMAAGESMPAHALFLESVEYDELR